jgi:hypothetical protein
MDDLIAALDRTGRAVADADLGGAPAHVVELRRRLHAPVADVWDACTDPDRVGRWFLPLSLVSLELTPAGDDTELVLRHTVPDDEHWARYGPGAVGVGWDGALAGFAAFIAGHDHPNDDRLMAAFMRQSAASWGTAHQAAGATAETARNATAQTSGFYAPIQPDGA